MSPPAPSITTISSLPPPPLSESASAAPSGPLPKPLPKRLSRDSPPSMVSAPRPPAMLLDASSPVIVSSPSPPRTVVNSRASLQLTELVPLPVTTSGFVESGLRVIVRSSVTGGKSDELGSGELK